MCIYCALSGRTTSWSTFDHAETGSVGFADGSEFVSTDAGAAQSQGVAGAAGSASFSRIVSSTGNPLVDGVLSGVAWNSGGQLSLSFPQSSFAYGNNYGLYGENADGFQPATQAQMQAARYA